MIGRRAGMRRGRPGLIGAAARTAVVAGTATAVSGRVAERQRARQMQQYEQQAQPAPAAPEPAAPAAAAAEPAGDDALDQLERLASLRERDLLSEQEFADAKQRLLGA